MDLWELVFLYAQFVRFSIVVKNQKQSLEEPIYIVRHTQVNKYAKWVKLYVYAP